MIGNEKYGDYVPDRVSPHLLSRDFLLSVTLVYIIFIVNSLCWPAIISKIAKYRKKPTFTN